MFKMFMLYLYDEEVYHMRSLFEFGYGEPIKRGCGQKTQWIDIPVYYIYKYRTALIPRV